MLMRLASMRYKGYTWPHNPEIYTVEYRRSVVVHKVPFGGTFMQDLGRTYRVMQGEGVFAGTDAYAQFQELETVFREEGAGILVHPVWQTVRARFVSLQLEEKPLPDYVHYSFTFWEEPDAYSAELTAFSTEQEPGVSAGSATAGDTAVYTVKKGDTLWGIAGRFQVSLTALIAANPQIKNPNLIYPGDRVQIP